MTLLDKIKRGVESSLNFEGSIYLIKDFSLAIYFIETRQFLRLKELIDSIIIKENRKEEDNRIITMDELVKTKELIDDYYSRIEDDLW